jgi:hypothetical protein
MKQRQNNSNDNEGVDESELTWIRQALDEQSAQLEAKWQIRLKQQRLACLQSRQPQAYRAKSLVKWPHFLNPRQWFIPAFALTSFMALMVGVWFVQQASTSQVPTSSEPSLQAVQQPQSPSLEGMEVILSNEDMDFLEHLEVYEWLARERGSG